MWYKASTSSSRGADWRGGGRCRPTVEGAAADSREQPGVPLRWGSPSRASARLAGSGAAASAVVSRATAREKGCDGGEKGPATSKERRELPAQWRMGKGRRDPEELELALAPERDPGEWGARELARNPLGTPSEQMPRREGTNAVRCRWGSSRAVGLRSSARKSSADELGYAPSGMTGTGVFSPPIRTKGMGSEEGEKMAGRREAAMRLWRQAGEESGSDGRLGDLPYLQWVAKEAMRLHPPTPLMLPHRANADVKLAGYGVPKGSNVLVNVWTIARNPAVWKDPLEFRPEWFSDEDVDMKGHDFRLLPFGREGGCAPVRS
ncbi:hypothetical protein Taro_005048 [Colocasia esculenta]|uniref:Cytochrome P450 n=1 Tax=Colocasia esculenta TaxID=4460 RepID=A0A843TJX9_COLES|nr:hypothetical protein [Colocasia esculenta]